jgi:hypothetical protein
MRRNEPLLSPRRILALLLVPYVLWLVFAYRYHFIDGANLLFHEAGHVFFGFFGQVLGILGGTLGQLFFPIVCIVYFYRQQKKFEAAVCGIWLGESMMYMAVYMGDARAQALPLVGNGHRIHDWHFLLGHWGLLNSAGTLASFAHGVASVLVVVSLGLTFLHSGRGRTDEPVA